MCYTTYLETKLAKCLIFFTTVLGLFLIMRLINDAQIEKQTSKTILIEGLKDIKSEMRMRTQTYLTPLATTSGKVNPVPKDAWYQASCRLCELSYPQFLASTTLSFRNSIGVTDELIFMNRVKHTQATLSASSAQISSIVWIIFVNTDGKDYAMIVEHGGSYLQSLPDSPTSIAMLTVALLVNDGSGWKADSFEPLSQIPLSLIRWKNIDDLRRIEAAGAARVVEDSIVPKL
jgi:hypothetical protein